MEVLEEMTCAPVKDKQQRPKTTNVSSGRMTVDEYIGLVREALDKRYEGRQG